ncbi:MAG: hypothetical protein JWM68_3911 [Verrucomicrobiales bacterium]|nr:hypothetical protein [Verrucomicrobiales bacterium]
MRHACCFILLFVLLGNAWPVGAEEKGQTEEDFKRQKLIEEHAKKKRASNYPALFKKAAKEFDVPVNLLEGIAFAETRWEHLVRRENIDFDCGMPPMYGIMGLWNNDYFGHSLILASDLIHEKPDVLKKDVFQNMRGGARLLKKIYDENPVPEWTKRGELESWFYAIVKYCGIPETDKEFSYQHALDVYEAMSQGYHSEGIGFDATSGLKLDAMRSEVTRVKTEALKKHKLEEQQSTNQIAPAEISPTGDKEKAKK